MDYLNTCIERGKYAWSAWLPVAAACVFIMQIAANISGLTFKTLPWFALHNILSSFELILLFVVSPIFFTRYANICAIAVLLYLTERFALSGHQGFNAVFLCLVAETTILAVLADRMPWHQLSFRSHSQKRLREILLQLLVVYGLISCLYTLLHLRLWQSWVYKQFSLSLNQGEAFIGVVTLVGIWFMVSLNMFRSSSLMLAIMPTLTLIAFMHGLPNDLLVVPFVLAMTLAIAQTRRRYLLTHD